MPGLFRLMLRENVMSENSSIARFDEHANEEIAAYEAYSRIYATRNPPPIRAAVQHGDTLVLLGLIILMGASIVVSGSRTIVEFGGGFVGVSAFVMIEIGIIAYAYIEARNNYSKEKHQRIQKLLSFGMYFALAVAIAANTHATLKIQFALPQVIDLALLITIAICAPVLAFISGEGWAMVAVSRARRNQQSADEYQTALDAWRTGLNQSWNGTKKTMMSRQTDRQKLSVVSERTDRQTDNAHLLSERTSGQTDRQTGYGFKRTADGKDKVIAHLMTNPSDADLPSRQLAELVGVGHDTANKGRNAWRELQQQPVLEETTVDANLPSS